MTADLRPNSRPLVFTDDAWLINDQGPLTRDIIREKMIEPLAGAGASLWWNIGNSEVYHIETEFGEIRGDGLDLSTLEGRDRRIAENVRHLIETEGGPLTVLIELCREAGIEFFPRVRMNSHYGYELDSVGYGRFRREHPECLIGRPGEDIPAGGIDWAVRTGLDFSFPAVRDHIYSITTELFERFDIDGVEMDFNRHPTFFRREEQTQNGYLMTDLVRRVRTRMREVEQERGRPIQLAVRVPPTLAVSQRIGLEVEKWIQEGLADIVIAGIGWIPFEMPIDEFVTTAEKSGHPVRIYGCIEGLRPTSDDRVIRAAAARFHRAGAGVYLYNFFRLPAAWQQQMLPVLADPAALARLDKRYELDHNDRNSPNRHSGAFLNALPAVQLPMVLDRTRRPPRIRIEVADDVEGARTDGALRRCVLGLLVSNFAPGDELEVSLNGHAYPANLGRVHYTGHGGGWPDLDTTCSVQFDLEWPPAATGDERTGGGAALSPAKGRRAGGAHGRRHHHHLPVARRAATGRAHYPACR